MVEEKYMVNWVKSRGTTMLTLLGAAKRLADDISAELQ